MGVTRKGGLTKYQNHSKIVLPFFIIRYACFQALTTGGIPGFVDVVLNFNSKQLIEDNIITQLKHTRMVNVIVDYYHVQCNYNQSQFI